MRPKAIVFAGLVGASFAGAACSAILDFSVPKRDIADVDASPDGFSPSDAGDDATDPCDDLGLPPPPPPVDAGPERSVFVALSALALGAEVDDAGVVTPLGRNLDRRCTDSKGQSSCTTVVTDQDFARYVKDGDAGADLAFYGVYQSIRAVDKNAADGLRFYSAQLESGRFQLLMRIRDYNGTKNDDFVRMDLYPSYGKSDDGGIDGPADLWTRDQSYRLSDLTDEASKLQSVETFVADGQLVARFPLVDFLLIDDDRERPLRIRFRDAILTATIARRDGRDVLDDGLVAGRIDAAELLAELGEVRIGGEALCRGQAASLLTSTICSARDLASSVLQDGTNVPCAALSAAARFQTYAVDALGPFTPPPARKTDCDGSPLACP